MAHQRNSTEEKRDLCHNNDLPPAYVGDTPVQIFPAPEKPWKHVDDDGVPVLFTYSPIETGQMGLVPLAKKPMMNYITPCCVKCCSRSSLILLYTTAVNLPCCMKESCVKFAANKG